MNNLMPSQPNMLLQGQQGDPSQQQQMPQRQAPAPTHEQTVAALQHFDAVIGAGRALMDSPGFGKSDISKDARKMMTGLLKHQIITAPQAVAALVTLPPDDPKGQAKWVMGMIDRSLAAEHQILSDHQNAFAGQEMPQSIRTDRPHHEVMGELMDHYKQSNRHG